MRLPRFVFLYRTGQAGPAGRAAGIECA